MQDPRLIALLKSIDSTQNKVLKAAQEYSGEDAWADITFGSIVLSLPGTLVSGDLISLRTYLKLMRDAAKASSVNNLAKAAAFAFFEDPGFPDEDSGEDNQVIAIYLANVVLMSGESRINMPQLVVRLESVQAWTLGRLPSR